jgi:hypothetical protein
MVLAGKEHLTQDALTFWASQLSEGVSDHLREWLSMRVEEVQVLWQNVGRLDRSRRMWKELSEQLEARDPTNPWARNYDRMYFDSQLLILTRTVLSGRRRDSRRASLALLLEEFRKWPQLLGPVAARDALHQAAEPDADMAELRRLLRPLLPWRDKYVAHIDLDLDGIPEPQWHQLDDAIDGVTDVFGLYSLRLTGVNYQVVHEVPGGRTGKRSSCSRSLMT